jgi:hypothetical protein
MYYLSLLCFAETVTSNQPGAQAVASVSSYIQQVTQVCLTLDVSVK